MSEGPWAADFSYGYFRRLLAALRATYEFRLFRDAAQPAGHPSCYIRHDVDVSLERALRMAQVEQQENVPATYMVMNRSLLYSLSSAESRDLLRRIAGLGHEIGLHFDYPDASRESGGAAPEALEREILIASAELEEALGAPVASLSFHRPVPSVIRGPLSVAGRINAYAAQLMQRYISDSKGQWREGEPLALVSTSAAPVLQVLIHPIWWGDPHRHSQQRLEEFVDERAAGCSREERSRLVADLAATLPGVARLSYGA